MSNKIINQNGVSEKERRNTALSAAVGFNRFTYLLIDATVTLQMMYEK